MPCGLWIQFPNQRLNHALGSESAKGLATELQRNSQFPVTLYDNFQLNCSYQNTFRESINSLYFSTPLFLHKQPLFRPSVPAQPELVHLEVWCTDFSDILLPYFLRISLYFHLCYILYLMVPYLCLNWFTSFSHSFLFFKSSMICFMVFQLPATVVKLGISPLVKKYTSCFTIMVENCSAGSSALINYWLSFLLVLAHHSVKNFRSLIMYWT